MLRTLILALRRQSYPRELTGLPHLTSLPRGAARWGSVVAGVLLLGGVCALDYVAPAPLSLDFLYLAPVFMVAWRTGRWGGLAVAVLGTHMHSTVLRATNVGAAPEALALDSLIMLGGLAAAAFLTSALRTAIEREQSIARRDALTGLLNRRAFAEQASIALAYARRDDRPFSLAFIDLDGFKQLNDTLGHAAGDAALRAVGDVLHRRLRATDVVARIGGDEFAIVLLGTEQWTATSVLTELREQLLAEMLAAGWPITFSIGGVAGIRGDVQLSALLHQADTLMYQVKRAGKDRLLIEPFSDLEVRAGTKLPAARNL